MSDMRQDKAATRGTHTYAPDVGQEGVIGPGLEAGLPCHVVDRWPVDGPFLAVDVDDMVLDEVHARREVGQREFVPADASRSSYPFVQQRQGTTKRP